MLVIHNRKYEKTCIKILCELSGFQMVDHFPCTVVWFLVQVFDGTTSLDYRYFLPLPIGTDKDKTDLIYNTEHISSGISNLSTLEPI